MPNRKIRDIIAHQKVLSATASMTDMAAVIGMLVIGASGLSLAIADRKRH